MESRDSIFLLAIILRLIVEKSPEAGAKTTPPRAGVHHRYESVLLSLTIQLMAERFHAKKTNQMRVSGQDSIRNPAVTARIRNWRSAAGGKFAEYATFQCWASGKKCSFVVQ
jgi:hypothetical protein